MARLKLAPVLLVVTSSSTGVASVVSPEPDTESDPPSIIECVSNAPVSTPMCKLGYIINHLYDDSLSETVMLTAQSGVSVDSYRVQHATQIPQLNTQSNTTAGNASQTHLSQQNESVSSLTQSVNLQITDAHKQNMRNAGRQLFKTFKFVSAAQMAWSMDPDSVCRMALNLCNLHLDDNTSNLYFWFHIKQQVQRGIATRRNTVVKGLERVIKNIHDK